MRKALFSLVTATYLLMGCGDGNVLIIPDPNVQFITDSLLMIDYFEKKGYDNFRITNEGVGYVILKEGAGESIDESDIVTFNYLGKLLDDITIFDTNIQAVGDSIRMYYREDSLRGAEATVYEPFLNTYPEDKIYNPFIITYSSSGWTISGQFIPGFIIGISETFNKMNVGGKSLIVIPSRLAYGTRAIGPFIPTNSVLIFELYPTDLTKQ